MAKNVKAPEFEVEDRIDKAEDLLVGGISPGRIERALAKDYNVSTRQARRYIAAVYDRWRQQTIEDAPHRREKIIRMAERFYSKCLTEKQYSAASNALILLARMSGAFTQHDPTRQERLAQLGPPPTDPTQALVWAQRCMVFALHEVISNPSLDPERRLRWIAELGGKLGMTHAKTLVQHKLDEVEWRVLGPGETNEADLESTTGLAFPATSRARRGHA